MDINSRMAYINKLKEQQKLTDLIIGQLQGAINFFNTFDRAARVFACMQTKIHSMHKTIDAKIAMVQNAHKEEDTLSSLPQIRANLWLLDDVISNTTQELDIMYKEVIEEELTEEDVNTLLEQATKMVDLTRETISQLGARLLEAATTIDEEEPKEEPKGEKQKESVETVENEPTPEMMLLIALLPGKLPSKQCVPYSSPTQLAHYARVKLNEYNEVAYPDGPILKNHKPESLNRPHPGEDPHECIMDNAVELDTLEKSKKSLKKLFT